MAPQERLGKVFDDHAGDASRWTWTPADAMSAQLDALRTFQFSEHLRILVVDDFAPFRKSVCSLLRDYEHVTIVGEAGDGEAAIEMAFQCLPHVIIMDVKMPRIGGVEATRRIKRFLPAVHIIGISTRDDMFIRDSLKAVGSSRFVTKDCAHTIPEVISDVTGSRITSHCRTREADQR